MKFTAGPIMAPSRCFCLALFSADTQKRQFGPPFQCPTLLQWVGKWTYLYRAVDSSGATIDFLLSSRRNAAAAKRFLQKALHGHPRPRVINVDGNPSYPKVIAELKKTGELGRRCRCRPVRYLNNIVEQDHRAIKRRVRASQGFRS